MLSPAMPVGASKEGAGMSKPRSGLFHGTMGERAIISAEQIIAVRTAGLDLREHHIGQKQLSASRMRKLSTKVAARTATKAEYRMFMWNNRFKHRRKAGIDSFWEQERERIISGQPTTRNWTADQTLDILNGKKPKFRGRTIQGHHTYSAAKFPHLADRGEVIYPATGFEHLNGWHGGNYRRSLPGRRIRIVVEF